MRSNAAASWLPASARSSASAVRKLIDSACSVASMIFINCRRASGRSMMRCPNTTRFLRHRHRVMMRAPHQRGRFDAVGKPGRIDHLGHLHEAAIELADRIGDRAFQLDLARGHRAGAELVLQPHDPVVILRTVVEPARHQEQADAARAGARAFAAAPAASPLRRRHWSRTIFRHTAASDRLPARPSWSACRRRSRLPFRS